MLHNDTSFALQNWIPPSGGMTKGLHNDTSFALQNWIPPSGGMTKGCVFCFAYNPLRQLR